MKILAFDTVAAAASVAVFLDGEKIFSLRENMDRGHSEALVPMIKKVISSISFEFKDLNLIAVTVGPGSFTGVRIGLSTARTLSMATKIPVIGVTSFDAVAAALKKKDWKEKPVLIALETKRDDFYVQIYENSGTRLGEPSVVESSELLSFVDNQIGLPKTLLVAGDGAMRAASAINKRNTLTTIKLGSFLIGPDAIQVAQIAHQNALSGKNVLPAEPFYLRAPHVN